jgi:ASC-1-like (ASCH) protein
MAIEKIKTYTLRLRAKDKAIFSAIKNGTKKVETRANTARYQHIQKGEKLVFVCGDKKLEKVIKRVSFHKNVENLLKTYRASNILPNGTKADLVKLYDSFPLYREKIKKVGIVAMVLEK